MSTNGIFSSNSPIERRDYLKNLIILAVIVFLTKTVFEHIIFGAVKPAYSVHVRYGMYFLYLVCTMGFLSLIDRRMFDICGTRNSFIYNMISLYTTVIIFLNLYIGLYAMNKLPKQLTMYGGEIMQITLICDYVYAFILLLTMLIPGKITKK